MNAALDTPKMVAPPQSYDLRPKPATEGERIPLRVQFDNDTSETRTVIDIETEDRVGLLYAISQVFADQKLDVVLAKISTEKGAAIDTFYVTDLDGQKIYSPEYQRSIHDNIRRAIAELDR